METLAFILIFSQVFIIIVAIHAVLRVECRSGEERKNYLARAEQNYKELADCARTERRELYARIQAWQLPEPEKCVPQIGREIAAPIPLTMQEDGTWFDPITRKVFETEAEAFAWRNHLKAIGLPLTHTPDGSEI